jgi:dTDP-4-amino-4,6-dideoxygalactose transaminase
MNNFVIPFNSLTGHPQEVLELLNEAFHRVCQSGSFILGDELQRFESSWAKFCGSRGCVGVASGTDALVLSLQACGVGSGDGVITVANSATATVSAIQLVGAVPIFTDINYETGLMDVEELNKTFCNLSIPIDRVKAIIAVHLYGTMCDVEALRTVAGKNGVSWVIEDAAHAHGACFNGHRAGSVGDIAAFSFYPTKPLGALGDAGAVVSNYTFILERVRELRNYGEVYIPNGKWHVGRNSRLDELQAAFLTAKLPYLEAWNARRMLIELLYRSELADTSQVTFLKKPGDCGTVHLIPVLVLEPDSLIEHLKRKGIQATIRYPINTPQEALNTDNIPKTRLFCSRVVCFPCSTYMMPKDVKTVCDAVKEFYKGCDENSDS